MNFLTNGNQPSIHRYSAQDGNFYSAYIEGSSSTGFILPLVKECRSKCDQQYFAVGNGSQTLMVKWNGKSTKGKIVGSIFEIEIESDSYWVGASTDSKGRFYGGTLSRRFCNSTPAYSFYRFDKKHHLDRLFDGTRSTTGSVFNEKEQKMYHIDTCGLKLTEYDWDSKTGDICMFLISIIIRLIFANFLIILSHFFIE